MEPHDSARDDRIRPYTRFLAFLIMPILVVAWVMLYLFPDRTGQFFSWPINPQMTALMLGATYLGGGYFFAHVLVGRRWHRIGIGIIPVSVFAGILGLATVLHWDRFTEGHPSFILWAILYFTLPWILPIAWWLNRRADPGTTSGPRLAPAARGIFAALGGLMAAVSVLFVVFPQPLIETWPWDLTPLTARVTGAMFALAGVVGLLVAADGRWSAARIVLEAQVVAVAFILLGLVRARAEIAWDSPSSWLFAGGLVAVLLAIGAAGLRMRGASRVAVTG